MQGLENDEAKERLAEQGPNVPKTKKKKNVNQWYRFFKNLVGLHNIQLWSGALLCFVVYFTDNYLIEHDLEVKPDNVSS